MPASATKERRVRRPSMASLRATLFSSSNRRVKMRNPANNEKPDGRCPTCGRGGGVFTPSELMARAIAPSPDPAVVANPPDDEEKAAEAAVAAAQTAYEIATQGL